MSKWANEQILCGEMAEWLKLRRFGGVSGSPARAGFARDGVTV